MKNLKFIIHHEGYWPIQDWKQLPHSQGMFLIHEGKTQTDQTVSIDKLLFIGDSNNIHQRLQQPALLDLLHGHLSPGKELFVSITDSHPEDRIGVLAAYIVAHRPVCQNITEWMCYLRGMCVISHGNLGSVEQVIDTQEMLSSSTYQARSLRA